MSCLCSFPRLRYSGTGKTGIDKNKFEERPVHGRCKFFFEPGSFAPHSHAIARNGFEPGVAECTEDAIAIGKIEYGFHMESSAIANLNSVRVYVHAYTLDWFVVTR
jgi:hypothetical protein